MSKDPARMVGTFGVLLGVWAIVFWWWGPSDPPISFGDRPEGFVEPKAGGAAGSANPKPLTRVDVEGGPTIPPDPSDVTHRAPSPKAGTGHGLGVMPDGSTRVLEKPRFRDYTVRKGDTSFEAIAARPEVYGQRRWASAIREANPFVSPDRLIVGKTVLRIAVDPTNVSGKIVTIPPPAPAKPSATPPKSPDGAGAAKPTSPTNPPPATKPTPAPANATPPTPTPPTIVYTVTSGDTLSGIAKKHYGKSALWTIILDANPDVLDDPAKLKAGMKLRLPPAPKD